MGAEHILMGESVMDGRDRSPRGILLRAYNTPVDASRYPNKRELLIVQGIRLFHRQGVHGTGVADVLAAANMGKGQFYHYFEGKEEFICAVVQYEMEYFLRQFGPIMRALHSFDDFERWFEPYLALADLPDNLGCPVGVIASEMSGNSDKVREAASETLMHWISYLEEGLRNLKSRLPGAAALEPREAAEFIAGVIQGSLLLGRTFRSNRYIKQARDQVRLYLELKAAG